MRNPAAGPLAHVAKSLVLGGCLMSAAADAATEVWLVGGGWEPEASEAQIEQNVLWAARTLEALSDDLRLRVYFTDGEDPRPDVLEWRPPPDSLASLQPLARVYDTYWVNGEHYRNHRIPDVAGPTTATLLARELPRLRSRLAPGDQALLVFNGHGGEGESPDQNRLLLWEGTSLTVKALEALLAEGPPAAPTRFVFTQCYGGGFARLAYRDADPDRGLSPFERCGFLAVAADQPAEGCSPALDLGEYRDYSTYFFAALKGRSRLDEALTGPPDLDGDGEVTPYEAHLFVLRHARSTDLPRSTSEDYLLRWKPWYLDWIPGQWGGDSHYAQLAEALAAEGQNNPQVEREALLQRLRALEREAENLQLEIQALREAVRAALERRWPGARHGHTRAFKEFLQRDLDAAQAFILAHPDYPGLRDRQDRYWAVVEEQLEVERGLAQLARIEHLRELDRILAFFPRWADEAERAEYRRLLACEQAPL